MAMLRRMPMSDSELQQCRAMLGVEPGIDQDTLRRAYAQKSYALIRSGAPEEERGRLRAAHAALLAHWETQQPHPPAAPQPMASPPTVPVYVPPPEPPNIYNPCSFDSRLINCLALPLVGGLAVLVTQSIFDFFLQGFHIWIHEFGHATMAWMTGKRALPLPIGWTTISDEKSYFVYFGILFLLGLLFVTSWKERKIWPMVFAVGLAGLQFYMTWFLPSEQARMWIIFGGVGGEFYLGAAMVGLFYCQFPEKFKWGGCRYFFLFIGASSFFEIYTFWKQVQRGLEDIPFGSMVNGENYGNGDMNILSTDFGWKPHRIIATYNHLGDACLAALALVYVIFALGLNRLPTLIWNKFRASREGS
jgi:hypothetical protein